MYGKIDSGVGKWFCDSMMDDVAPVLGKVVSVSVKIENRGKKSKKAT